MSTLLIVLALALVAGVAAFATSRVGRMGDEPPDLEPVDLPDDRLVLGRDVDRLRFAVGLRGYRMEQVDEVLDRISADLEQREGYVDDLTAALVAAGVDVPPRPVPEREEEAVSASDPDDAEASPDDEAAPTDASDEGSNAESDAESDADIDADADDAVRPGA